jgi:hypothetical protein
MLPILRSVEKSEAADSEIVGLFLAGVFHVCEANREYAVPVYSGDTYTLAVLQYLKSR